ncbi:MAG: hypothetical protein ACUVWZ_14615 [Anaerolineae bacterium]
MITWRDFLAQQERYRDWGHEAEGERFVQQVLAGRERRNHWYCRALIWLGQRLVAWGLALQKRYEIEMASTALSDCESCAISGG